MKTKLLETARDSILRHNVSVWKSSTKVPYVPHTKNEKRKKPAHTILPKEPVVEAPALLGAGSESLAQSKCRSKGSSKF